jgi:hypothetical protein
MCRGLWQCGRWDGEVTLEELRGQRPAPLFYISVAFLVSWVCKRFAWGDLACDMLQ